MNISTIIRNVSDIAIGNFDGMHIGHQRLFSHLSIEKGAIFVINNNNCFLTLNDDRKRYSSLPIYYIDLIAIKHLDAKSFIELLCTMFVDLKRIVVGYDFSFGKDRKYSINDLKKCFKGEVLVVPKVTKNGLAVHSGTIKRFLFEGDIKSANAFFGHNYEISGDVVSGQGIGKRDLFPTININVKDYFLPKDGVYLTLTSLDGQRFNSLSFIGNRQSTDNNFSVETHILDRDIRNKFSKISISFLNFLRENKKFSSLYELKNTINNDIKKAREFFTC